MTNEPMKLGLKVIDDFLPKELFEKLSHYCTTLEYDNGLLLVKEKLKEGQEHYSPAEDSHFFYSNRIYEGDDLLKDLEKAIIKHFGVRIKNFNLAAFTLVNTKKPKPHKDKLCFPNEQHLLLYLKGESSVNAGTGFYEFKENNFNLNTAIGYYPNRALLFKAAECYHSSLLYAQESNTPRFSIIIWFEPESAL